MSRNLQGLKDHWFPVLLGIFGAGFATAWFIWEEILIRPLELQSQNNTSQFEEVNRELKKSKERIEELQKSLEVTFQEKTKIQTELDNYTEQIDSLKEEVEDERKKCITEDAVREHREKALEKKLKNECIAKMAIILDKIEKVKKECRDNNIIDDIIQQYKEEQKSW